MDCYHAIFISDTHLGTQFSQPDSLLKKLSTCSSKYLYLVGDIFDDHLSRHANWDDTFKLIHLLIFSKHFEKIFFIPGNHDQFLFSLLRFENKNFSVNYSVIHQSLNKKKYVVTHGDQFDWTITHLWNIFSHSGHFLRKIISKKALKFINKFLNDRLYDPQFEIKINQFIDNHHVDGLICGHYHDSKITPTYMNCGDWMDSFTFLVENLDGTFDIIN